MLVGSQGIVQDCSGLDVQNAMRSSWIIFVGELDRIVPDDCIAALVLPELTGRRTAVFTGIPQVSPPSPILYLFYNAGLLESCASGEVDTIGCIDHVSS